MNAQTIKIMVYSHDAYGLGNIRRMLSICEHLLQTIPNLSILLLSGSPMLQSFRLPKGLDYIKLPGINRNIEGKLSNKYLDLDVETTLQMRSDLILAAARNFQPDLVIVDKKPYGLRNELKSAIRYLKCILPQTKFVLLLRDILDSPDRVIKDWESHYYFSAADLLYDQILVVGMREVFDLYKEYQFPTSLMDRVHFCGYLRKPVSHIPRSLVRQRLGLRAGDRFILVTPGGGEDGYRMINTYLQAADLPASPLAQPHIQTLIITGSEMSRAERAQLATHSQKFPRTRLLEFTDDLMLYINAADLVICMAGYNTVTEVLSQGKWAITVPRIKPGCEQLIRANRLEKLGLLRSLNPIELTPSRLASLIDEGLLKHAQSSYSSQNKTLLNFDGLHQITHQIQSLLDRRTSATESIVPSPIVASSSHLWPVPVLSRAV